MISAFVGTPGSGKSYDAVRKIVDNLRERHRPVYTNIEGMGNSDQIEYLRILCGFTDSQINDLFVFLTDDQMERVWEHLRHQGALIVVDECHKRFSNRDWQTDKNKYMNEWASTHRHEGHDLILITQGIGKIDSHLRTLVEWTHFYRKINFLGGAVKNEYMVYSYSGDDHEGTPIKKSVYRYQSKYYPCYKSYVTGDIKENAFMKHVNVLMHPVFFLLPCVIGLFLYLFFAKSSFATGKFLQPRAASASVPAAQNKPAAKPFSFPFPSATPSPAPPVPADSAPDSHEPLSAADRPVRHGGIRAFYTRNGVLQLTNLPNEDLPQRLWQ